MKTIKFVIILILLLFSVKTIFADFLPDRVTIITSEERIPQVPVHVIPEEYIIPPVQTAPSSLQVPIITTLAQGMWYVQIAAFSRMDHVERIINRMGTSYPIAIHSVGTSTNPLFRILLGPLNQSDSAAVLQRVKNMGYGDAFVRFSDGT